MGKEHKGNLHNLLHQHYNECRKRYNEDEGDRIEKYARDLTWAAHDLADQMLLADVDELPGHTIRSYELPGVTIDRLRCHARELEVWHDIEPYESPYEKEK